MLQLFPDPGPVELADAYSDLRLAELAPADRPYTIVNMVSTADGQARVAGNTEDLGNEADQKLFIQLREQVDCVMAGSRTIEIEQYNGLARKPETRARREQRGLRARPIFATATRRGVLPVSAPLFQDPEMEIVVFSEAELAAGDARASVVQVRESDPKAMLAELREHHGITTLLLEGGPHINTPFFGNDLIDELFLTVAPLLTGAADPFPIIAGLLPERLELDLVSVLLDDDNLFLRYRVVH